MRRWLAAGILFTLLATGLAAAGVTGQISGTIVDDKDQPVAGATVTVHSDTAEESTTTDEHGHFIFISLPPGIYVAILEKDRYMTVKYTHLVVNAGEVTPLQGLLQHPPD